MSQLVSVAEYSEQLIGPLPTAFPVGDLASLPVYEKQDGEIPSVLLVPFTESNWVVSEDGSQIAAIEAVGAGVCVWANGARGPVCDEVKGLRFLPRSNRLVYGIRRGDKWAMVVDQHEQALHDFIDVSYHWVAFSDDGRHVGYVAKDGDRFQAFVDGEPVGKSYPGIGEDCNAYSDDGYRRIVGGCRLMFSRDGKHVAWVARPGGDQALVVVDGKEGPVFPAVGVPVLSDDGSRVAYPAHAKDGKCHVVVDGKVGPGYDDIEEIVFGPDGKRVGYVAMDEDARLCAVIDGVAGPWFDQLEDIVFSPDSRRVVYSATRNDKAFVMENDKHGPVFDEIGTYYASSGLKPAFSPDSRRLAYVGTINERKHVVVDGQSGPGFRDLHLTYTVFSPDSRHVAYSGDLGEEEWVAVVDGKQSPVYDVVLDPVYSADGAHVFFEARRDDKEWVLVDGVPGAELGLVMPGVRFSSDGKHVGCGTSRGEQSMVVVDGVVKHTHGKQLSYTAFSPTLSSAAWVTEDKKVDFHSRLVSVALDSSGTAGGTSSAFDGISFRSLRYSPEGVLTALAARNGNLYRITCP
ncbi:hypothetical protein LLH03_03025 [bacterium]|nr:hypothetical protein [bacterium]